MTQQHIESILVGTSLHEGSDPVVLSGAELARRTGAALYLIHAHTMPLTFFEIPGATGGTVQPDLLETERHVRRQMLDEQLARVGVEREEVTDIVIADGAAHRQVLDTAGMLDVDLIVLGSRETHGLRLLGSTSDRILRKAHRPVWVVSGTPCVPPCKVLAPVDLSPLSGDCLCRGMGLVDQILASRGSTEGGSGADEPELEALFVLTREQLGATSQFTPEQVERLASEELERFLVKLRLPSPHAFTRKVRTGEIRKEILEEIEEFDVDLVVLGTHGRSGFERFLLGSVAADIAGRSPCSVLVIPPRFALEEARDRIVQGENLGEMPGLAATA